MLLVMAGVAIGGVGGWKGTVMAPEGTDFVVAQKLRAASPFATLPPGEASWVFELCAEFAGRQTQLCR